MKIEYSPNLIAKLLFLLIGVIIFGFGVTLDYQFKLIACGYVMAASLYLLWWSRNNTPVFLCFLVILYCNYSIAFSEYFVVIKGILFTKYAYDKVASVGIFVLTFFFFNINFFVTVQTSGYSKL